MKHKSLSVKSKFLPGFSLAVAVLLVPISGFASDEVGALLARVRSHVSAHDDSAEVEMTIIESNGDKKVRKLRLETLQDSKFHAIAEILTPMDVKGTKVLSEVDKETENQWLYTPSSRQVRRLMSEKSGAGVLGSEITMDDLNSTAIKSLHSKITKQDSNLVVIQLSPKRGTSVYDRVDLTISKELEIPLRTEYYKSNKLLKVVEFSGYKKYGALYRAQHVIVKNKVNHRGTNLNLISYQPNHGLKVADFSPSRLKNN